MQLNNLSKSVMPMIEKYSHSCTITTKDGLVITSKVMAEQLWKRDKVRFESYPTDIGLNQKTYIIGIFTLDITGFGREDILTLMDKDYYFIKSSAVVIGDEILYYTAVLREAVKGDEDVFG
ncbi:hypothetical protein [Eubacterium sp.]